MADQVGRLTFTTELARATKHLVDAGAPFGTYNVTNGGEPASWADLAKRVFELSGRSAEHVTATTTAQWAEGKVVSPRPQHSGLDLAKIRSSGFEPADQWSALAEYVASLGD